MRRAFAISAVLLVGAAVAVVALTTGSAPFQYRASYVSSGACAACHVEAHAAWAGTDHQRAWQIPSPQTVLGDFADARFEHFGATTTFHRRGEAFVVRTAGADGVEADFEVVGVVGVAPLQQYLIELGGGRLQSLSVCWDTRPAAAGGQRWFHLYPNEAIPHDDVLHWTGSLQRFNSMCAECHATDLRKGYDQTTGNYATTSAELGVGCEACHGPGGTHVRWATRGEPWGPASSKGFYIAQREPGAWVRAAGEPTAHREPPRRGHAELDACAHCHARRTPLVDAPQPGAPFLDGHLPALLDEGLYHVDGQIRDEVYEYGSFLQSRMHAAGVTCSDCHEPHTQRLRAEGNALCAQCHDPATFDVPAHHHHAAASTGAKCVDCHMPVRTYMVVDPRRDHSLRVPRPDLGVALGVPDACTACHADRDAKWAAAAVTEWRGAAAPRPHFATALAAGRAGGAPAAAALRALASDPQHPAIARATALAMLGTLAAPVDGALIRPLAAGADPLLRYGAMRALEAVPPATRVELAAAGLRDAVRTVRIEAARQLADVPDAALAPDVRTARAAARGERMTFLAANAEWPWAHLDHGLMLQAEGDPVGAAAEYAHALRLDPAFVPAISNLADLHRAQGRDADAEAELRRGLRHAPDAAAVHHALGLALVRLRRGEEALRALQRATELAPADVRFAYVFAVALHSGGDTARAVAVLERTHARHPGDFDVLMALATFERDRGARAIARQWAERLLALAPDDPGVQALVAGLRR